MSERLTKRQLKEDRFLDTVQHVIAYARDHLAVVVLGALAFIALVVLAVRIGGQAAGIESAPGNPEAQRALVEARAEFAMGRLDTGTQALREVRDRWSREDAGREATYVLANALFEAGDFEAARRTFEEFLERPLHGDLLRDGARLGIAACREEMDDPAGALEDYRMVAAQGTTPGTRLQAMLAAARCARELGRPDEARQLLGQVMDRYPESPEARDAEFQLRMLDAGEGA